MFGRETRMLLKHYLEQGASKSALARRLGVSRDTLHRGFETATWTAIWRRRRSSTGHARRSRRSWTRIAASSRRPTDPQLGHSQRYRAIGAFHPSEAVFSPADSTSRGASRPRPRRPSTHRRRPPCVAPSASRGLVERPQTGVSLATKGPKTQWRVLTPRAASPGRLALAV